jgi:predicted RecB family nuclease
MGRYASREDAVDSLLTQPAVVDLYSVVRKCVRASGYSIKKLEPLCGYTRDIDLVDANRALFKIEAHPELDGPEFTAPDDVAAVEGYNRDDCLSTRGLRDWLAACRKALIADGVHVPWPDLTPGEPPDRIAERQMRIDAPPQPYGSQRYSCN